MNIIQSFWSKPAFHKEQNYQNSRGCGGWPHQRYLWLSTAYSFYCAKKYHRYVNLVADSPAYNILVGRLGIPYDEANTLLDALENEDHRLWILGKVMALKDQAKPFIHVENDVFLYGPLPASHAKDFLIAQSRIIYPDKYRAVLRGIFEHFAYVPDAVRKQGVPDDFSVINIGIIGGNDIGFFQEYCETAEQFVQRNRACLSKINTGLFSNLSDEYLFSCLVKDQPRKVDLYIDVSPAEVWNVVMRFNLVPFIDKYIHLAGLAKQNRYACEQFEYRFRFEFPEEYGRISGVLSEMCPLEPAMGNDGNKSNWKQLQKALTVLYTSDVKNLSGKKVRLSESVQIKEQTTAQGETGLRISVANKENGSEHSWLLKEMDETLVHFGTPVCIDELLEVLKAEGYVCDEASLEHYRFKLIDFVTEKMTMDGVLEFA